MSRSLRYRLIQRSRNNALKIRELVKRRLEAESSRGHAETLEGIEFGAMRSGNEPVLPFSMSLPKPVEPETLTASQLESLMLLRQKAQENGFDVEVVSTSGTPPLIHVELKRKCSERMCGKTKALSAPSTDFIDLADFLGSKPNFEKVPLRKESNHVR